MTAKKSAADLEKRIREFLVELDDLTDVTNPSTFAGPDTSEDRGHYTTNDSIRQLHTTFETARRLFVDPSFDAYLDRVTKPLV